MIVQNFKPLFWILLVPGFIACHHKKDTDSREKQLDAYLSGQQQYHRFNGNVLVAEKGEIILQKSYGLASFDTGRPLNDSSVFELASVSKQFTAMSILLLKEKGLLKLSDSLRKYFPELPYPGITIQQMLTHTSGLPDYESSMNEKWDKDKIAFNSDMIAFLAKEKPPVSFAPGKSWEYSNTAYAILASIVEKLSAVSFAQFMKENIFDPLGMRHTRIYNTRRSLKDTIANYAYGYVYNDSLERHILPDSLPDLRFVIYLDGIQGDGVVNSTTADLLTWDRALKENKLLPEATQKEMLSGQSLMDTATKAMYGYGVMLEKNELGNVLSHSGGWPGYVTFLARNTDSDQTFIVLSNNGSPSPNICKALGYILAGKPVQVPYEHKAIRADTVIMDQLAGTWLAPNEIKLERRGDRLFRVSPGGRSVELKPESATKFFYTDGSDRQIEIEKSSDGKTGKAWVIAYGIKTELKKK